MDSIITVISPCYNSEKTLKRCIESIISQSIGFENIELILYDDASTDDTRKIIESYIENYENIIPIFSDVNQGPGAGKDLGISKATGKYIMFIDSDDEYDEKMCEKLFNEITDDIDVVSCNYVNIVGDSSEIVYCKLPDYKLKDKTLLPHNELIYLESFFVVNKIFKRDIIIKNNVRFTSMRNGEDELFLRHYLLYSKNLVHLNKYVGYIIYKQPDSISNSQSVNDLYSYLSVCRQIKDIYGNHKVNISKILKKRIGSLIQELYFKDILIDYDKNQLYCLLDELRCFEKEISFNESLGVLNNVSNFFIMHKQYLMVVIYSKVLYHIRKSRLMLEIYRFITQRN